MEQRGPRGVLPAIITPVDARLEPDLGAFERHARWLLASGASGLNVLGTTGEAPSFSVTQRRALFEGIAERGLPVDRMLVGTGAAALADAVTLTRAAVQAGYGGALVIPPFYFKDVDEDGVFAFYAALVERVRDQRLRLYLYHFPRLSGVPFTAALVRRLVAAFPETIAGMKDSSGDPALLAQVHADAPHLALFPSTEGFLVEARRLGYAGCISATVNVLIREAAALWNAPDAPDAGERQARLAAQREAIRPTLRAVRALVAEIHGDPVYARPIPPEIALTPEETAALRARVGVLAGSGA